MADIAYGDGRVADFQRLVSQELEAMHKQWANTPGTVHDDTALAFGRAALRWAGVKLPDEEIDQRVRQTN